MPPKLATWPPRELIQIRRGLDELVATTRDDNGELEPEVRAFLARLLVVRSAGYIEQGTSICARGHVQERSGGHVRSFALSWLERSKNPSPANLLELVGRFDQRLADQLEAEFAKDQDRWSRELSFLVDRRNKIAHGLNEGIGPSRALELAAVSGEIVDWFILRMNPLAMR